MTTNIAESLNSVLKSEKAFPIYALLVGIQKRLSKWFCNRRTVAGNHSKSVTPNVEEQLLPRYHSSRCMAVDRLNDIEFNVRGIGFEYLVNLSRGHCSCRVFDIDRIPCEHAIAALRAVEGDVSVGEGDGMGDQIRNLCHKYSTEYWRNVYEMTIYPTPHIREWMKPDEAPEITVKPPKAKIPRGRKRENRIPSTGEFPRPTKAKRPKKCSRCHTQGHTIKKCPEPADDVNV
jgi:SWIM zinc finger